MSKIATVTGIERKANWPSQATFSFGPYKGQWEVLMTPQNKTEQRIAVCEHKGHARDLCAALEFAHEHGIV